MSDEFVYAFILNPEIREKIKEENHTIENGFLGTFDLEYAGKFLYKGVIKLVIDEYINILNRYGEEIEIQNYFNFDLIDEDKQIYKVYFNEISEKFFKKRFLSFAEFEELGNERDPKEKELKKQIYFLNVKNGAYPPTEKTINHYLNIYFSKVKQSKINNFFLYEKKFYLLERHFKKHCYISGNTGAGKSNLIKLIIKFLSKNKNNIILIDPHGDLAEAVYLSTFTKNKTKIYIDPCKYLKEGLSPIINPFDLFDNLTDYDIDLASQELTRVFEELLKNASLSLAMSTILKPCIAVLIKRPNSTLKTLLRFFDDNRNGDLIELGKQGSYRDFFNHFFLDKKYDITKASLKTKLQSLLNSQIFKNITCGKSTIDIKNLLNTTDNLILFNLSKGKIGAEQSEAFGRFIIAIIQAFIMMRANTKEQHRKQTYLIIDEFQNYISPSIDIILTEARKYKLSLVLSNQILGHNTNPTTNKIILSNTNIKFVGKNDLATLGKLAPETGFKKEDLQNLRVGQFAVKSEDIKPVIVQTPLIDYRQGKEPTNTIKYYKKNTEEIEETKLLNSITEEVEERQSSTIYQEKEETGLNNEIEQKQKENKKRPKPKFFKF